MQMDVLLKHSGLNSAQDSPQLLHHALDLLILHLVVSFKLKFKLISIFFTKKFYNISSQSLRRTYE